MASSSPPSPRGLAQRDFGDEPPPEEGTQRDVEPVETEVDAEPGSAGLPSDLQARGIMGLLRGHISVKIVLPFIVVMFVLAIGGSYVVLNLVTGSLAQRFTNQLLDAGKNVNDNIVKVEGQELELLRLMTNTEGVDQALIKGDAPGLQKLLVPLQANSNFSFVDVLDASGKQVLALRPNDPTYLHALDPKVASWDAAARSLKGDSDSFGNKWTELVDTSFGRMLYTGGPVTDANGHIVGAVLVGIPFDDLIKQLNKDVLANVTIYTQAGAVLGSTLPLPKGGQGLALDSATLSKVFGADPQTVQRPINVDGQSYMELLGGFVIRDKLAGSLGVAIPTNAIDRSGEQTRTQLTIMFTAVTVMILIVGLIQARRISGPINILVQACRAVSHGDLETNVQVHRTDETGVLAHSFNQMIEGLRERDKIRDTFGRYMTQQVSDAILKGDVKLGGETRELTMLMSDIRGFTTLSETMTPESLVAFLNRYFTEMIECVMAHDGVVDKFMGDAILVVYGAPVTDPDHPIKAVLTALDMRQKLVKFNEELIAEGHVPIRIGIGVNTGQAITGNIGSEVRMEYTVIGDTVNATQRTEDLTKEFKTDILISESTMGRLDGRFILSEAHHITLRGRSQESSIYPVIGLRSGAAELWGDHGPVVLGEAPRAAQDFADAALRAAAEGRLLADNEAQADMLVQQSLKALADEQRSMLPDVEIVPEMELIGDEPPHSNGHNDWSPAAPAMEADSKPAAAQPTDA